MAGMKMKYLQMLTLFVFGGFQDLLAQKIYWRPDHPRCSENAFLRFFAEFDSPPKSNLRLEVNQLYIDGTNKVCHVWPDGCRLENLYIFLTCNCEETGRYSYAVAIRIPARWVNNMGYGVYVFDGDTKVKESCEFEIRDKLVRNCSNTREVYYYPFLRSKNGHQRSQVSPLALFVSVVSAGILQLKLSDLVLRRS